jgi:hypothetical protein
VKRDDEDLRQYHVTLWSLTLWSLTLWSLTLWSLVGLVPGLD